MNHQGLRWNVHCVANVALRIRLNLYKRGFKIYDLLVTFLNSCGARRRRGKDGKHDAFSEGNRRIQIPLAWCGLRNCWIYF